MSVQSPKVTVRAALRTIDCGRIDVGDDIEAEAVALQLHVTIERIETAEQLVLASTLGCDSVQGFYFSTSVSAGAVISATGVRRQEGLVSSSVHRGSAATRDARHSAPERQERSGRVRRRARE
jgi:predicted signal transduction protein with EAL and GGDEF domain